MHLIADTGNQCQPATGDYRHSVRSKGGRLNNSRLQCFRIDACEACRSPIGDENLTFIGDDTCRLGEAVQRRHVAAGIVIDHLDPIKRGMCDEHAACLRIESSVIKVGIGGTVYLDLRKNL